MMNWNYRVFCEDNGDYIIREVFYTEDGLIFSCTENSVEPCGRTFEELIRDLESFQQALSLPILTLADIPTGEVKQKLPGEQNKSISHEQLLVKLGLSHKSTIS